MNDKETRSQYIVGIIMLLIGALIVYFAISFMTKDSSNVEVATGKYSVDNTSQPYKTLSYAEAFEKISAEDGKQMFYLGCRDCPHCINLERTMTAFLNSVGDKNTDRDLIYKIEAGYTCVPETGDADYNDYAKMFDLLVEAGVVEDTPSKSFGTPQFVYIENGKVADELDNYGRNEAGLKGLFEANSYRGF